MRVRDNAIYFEQLLDETGTFIADLKFRDPLSALSFKFQGTAGATSNKANWMNDVVTKVEIVDGSDVLASVSLKELQALQHWLHREVPVFEFGEYGGAVNRDNCTLHFGRKLWDPEYYLDLKKFTNPQLKVTTDEDVIRAIGATGFLVDTFKMSMTAHLIEEGAPPSRGFIMRKEINSFTAAASGEIRVDLPRDYPYLAILLHSTTRGIDFNEAISRIKLTADTDRFVPFDRRTNEWLEEVSQRVPVLYNQGVYLAQNATTIRNPINYEPRFNPIPRDTNHTLGMELQFSGDGLLRDFNAPDGAAITTDERIFASVLGYSLHCSVPIIFGLEDPGMYLDPKKWADLELVLTQAGAYAVKVTTAQMRP